MSSKKSRPRGRPPKPRPRGPAAGPDHAGTDPGHTGERRAGALSGTAGRRVELHEARRRRLLDPDATDAAVAKVTIISAGRVASRKGVACDDRAATSGRRSASDVRTFYRT